VLCFASKFHAPLAIRYPKGKAFDGLTEFDAPIVLGKSEMIYKERDIAILAVGSMMENAIKVRELLKEQGKNVTLVNVRFVKPIDEEMLAELCEGHSCLITMEENVITGSYGMAVLRYINQQRKNVRVINIALPNSNVEQGSRGEQFKECGIDVPSIMKRLEEEDL
ncbi:MAG: transketolase C-terminal domain-containing protein, partial [Lachnospiraceae bacterium]|nr:transketolase C-terminal domain-containing protein [Lachnospiraceae bacterium]